MGMDLNVWVGPFAQWTVRKGTVEPDLHDTMRETAGCCSPPTIVIYGKPHENRRYISNWRYGSPRGPERAMSWDGHGDWSVVLHEVDVEAEKQWLAGAHADSLATLAAAYGIPPFLSWGILAWYS